MFIVIMRWLVILAVFGFLEYGGEVWCGMLVVGILICLCGTRILLVCWYGLFLLWLILLCCGNFCLRFDWFRVGCLGLV